MYYLYHIPGKKIGVTCDLENRVTKQQGYEPHEYEVLDMSEDIELISNLEIFYQKEYGYKVDMKLYKDLYKLNNNNMRINVTEQTTTFPCPVNKLKGNLMDNIGMKWGTDHGEFSITKYTIPWIMENVKTSQYTNERCYVYNKAFARFYDNHQTHDMLGGNLKDAHMRNELDNARKQVDQYGGKCRSGALASTGVRQWSERFIAERCTDCGCDMGSSQFELIRQWAEERGLYDNGDPKTQALKLVEEVGETCRAILKQDHSEIVDGIGDCVVVLTNLAELVDTPIEDCIEAAYNEIKDRKGKMVNGTYKKD